jgi:SNF2 family DNA or RNA helicase
MTCPSCNQIFTETHPREIAENDDEAPNHRARKTKKQVLPANSKGRDALGFEPMAESTWLTQSDNDEAFPLTPSAKTAALKATLLKGFDEAPLDKVNSYPRIITHFILNILTDPKTQVVIYVQFRLLARIVGRMCASEGWSFLYLSGDCSLEHRTKATKLFRDDPEVRILIAGLKCGGLG